MRWGGRLRAHRAPWRGALNLARSRLPGAGPGYGMHFFGGCGGIAVSSPWRVSRAWRGAGFPLSYDLRSDYRILVAEHALDILEGVVRGKRLPAPLDWRRALSLVGEARSLLNSVKYSFMPARMAATSEPALRLRDVAKSLAETLLPRGVVEQFLGKPSVRRVVAEVKYAIRILYGLPARLALGDDNDPLYAVDIECVEVLSVAKHPNADNLYVTRARGLYTYTIITNLQDVRRGDVRAAAILPPVELRGQLSEAMYCSGRLDGEGCRVGRRPSLSLVDRAELERVIYQIVRGR